MVFLLTNCQSGEIGNDTVINRSNPKEIITTQDNAPLKIMEIRLHEGESNYSNVIRPLNDGLIIYKRVKLESSEINTNVLDQLWIDTISLPDSLVVRIKQLKPNLEKEIGTIAEISLIPPWQCDIITNRGMISHDMNVLIAGAFDSLASGQIVKMLYQQSPRDLLLNNY